VKTLLLELGNELYGHDGIARKVKYVLRSP